MAIRILLADDHEIMRDGLRAILAKQPDFQVIADAADGLEAVRVGIEACPDVALMDINMPLLNGIEATRRLLDQCPETQVIILSMHGTKEHVYQALSSGARGYLLKETSGRDVVGAIRAVHAGQRFLSPSITNIMIDDYIAQRNKTPESSPLAELSDREREVLQLVAEGKSNSEIGELLHLSINTVSTYRSRMMKKANLQDLPHLIQFAIENGIIGPK